MVFLVRKVWIGFHLASDNKGSQKLLLNGLARNIIIQYQIKTRLEIEQLYWILVTLHWCYTCGVAILFTLKKDTSKEIRVPIMEQWWWTRRFRCDDIGTL